MLEGGPEPAPILGRDLEHDEAMTGLAEESPPVAETPPHSDTPPGLRERGRIRRDRYLRRLRELPLRTSVGSSWRW